MSARRLGLSTRQLAGLFAFSFMAWFAAKMRAAGESFSAQLAARNILTPTRDCLDLLLAALAEPFGQVRALGTCFVVRVTVMGDWRVSARWGPGTREAAARGLRAAWNRWIDGRPSAVTGQLFE